MTDDTKQDVEGAVKNFNGSKPHPNQVTPPPTPSPSPTPTPAPSPPKKPGGDPHDS